jgi:hypothetical protein
MANINGTSPPPFIAGAGIGGIEAPRGNLAGRLFRVCKGKAARAARSLSSMVTRITHFRPRGVPLVRGEPGRGRRASIRPQNLAVLGSAQMRDGNRLSPGAMSSNSVPNSVLRRRPATPSPTSPAPMVRLKPGRSAGTPPPKVSGGSPPLPARSPELEDRFQGRLSPSPRAGVNPGSGSGLNPNPTASANPSLSAKPVPPPRSRSADNLRLATDPQPRIAAGDRPTPPPRSRSADSARLPTDPQPRPDGGDRPIPPPRSRPADNVRFRADPQSRITGDGRPPLPPRPAIAPQRTAPEVGPMLVFHRKDSAGPPITARVGSLLPPKPPGNDEPLR